MGHDIVEAGLTAGVDRGEADQRASGAFALIDQVGVAELFRDDGLVGAEKRERPRLDEIGDPRIDVKIMELALTVERVGEFLDFDLAAFEQELLLADVDHHRADILVAECGAPRRHFLLGVAELDALRDTLVVIAVEILLVEQGRHLVVGRRHATLKFRAVAVGAVLGVDFGDFARGAHVLRDGQGERRERCSEIEEGGGAHGMKRGGKGASRETQCQVKRFGTIFTTAKANRAGRSACRAGSGGRSIRRARGGVLRAW